MRDLQRAGIIVDIVFAPRYSGSDIAWGVIDPAFLAKATSGVAYAIGASDLAAKLDRRVEELRSGYMLTFRPVPCTPGTHRLAVRLRNHRGDVNARGQYQCPGSLGRTGAID